MGLIYSLLLAGVLFGQDPEKILITPPSKENRQTRVKVTAPLDPEIRKTYNLTIDLESENPRPKRFGREGQISDTYIVLATNESVLIGEEVRVEAWSRVKKEFVGLERDGKIKNFIVRQFGEYITSRAGVHFESYEDNLTRRLTETKRLLEDRIVEGNNHDYKIIPINTTEGQDPMRDAIRVTILITFTKEVVNLPLALTYDASGTKILNTSSAETISLTLDDIVNFKPKQISLEVEKGNEVVLNYIPPGKYYVTKDNNLELITIEKGYFIGETEITNRQFEPLMDYTPSRNKGRDNPVDNVIPQEADQYCRNLSHKLKQNIRLPKRSEWEVAARVDSTTNFYFGDDGTLLKEYDTTNTNSNGTSSEVRTGIPNKFGLYNIHSNVREVCRMDIFDGENYYVLFGGSYNDPPEESTLTSTVLPETYSRENMERLNTGFRILLEP